MPETPRPPRTPELLWTLTDVTLDGGERPRLCGLTLQISSGSTAIVGSSGAGKTSLLDLLAGYLQPSSGRIVFAPDAASPDSASPVQATAVQAGAAAASPGSMTSSAPSRRAARLTRFWVPADGGLWPHLSARAQLVCVHPAPALEARAEAERLIAAFDLRPCADDRPGRLWYGQRQRLAVARAIATRARVLLLDEPLVHVGPEGARHAWELLRAHAAEHDVSLVFATHDPSVLASADRIVPLSEGSLAPPSPLALDPARPVPHGAAHRGDAARGDAAHGEAARGQGTGGPLASSPTTQARSALHLILVAFAWLLATACSGGPVPLLRTRHVRHHAMPPCDTRIPAPRCVVPGEPGETIVLDTAGRVLILDHDGAVRRLWFMPEHSAGRAEGACRMRDGRIVVADTHYHRLVYFDRTGRVLGMRGSEGRGPGQFIYPVRIVQDPRDFLYMAEYGSNDRVQKLTPDGEPVLAFGRFGTGLGELQRPSGLAYADGEVFVSDAMNGRIQVFGEDGTFRRTLPQGRKASTVSTAGTASPAGNASQAGARPDAQADGQADGLAGAPATRQAAAQAEGQADAGLRSSNTLDLPYDIAIGSDGLLYVVEYGGGCVTQLTRDGVIRARFGKPGTGQLELSTPWALMYGPDRTLWIADTGNRRIVEVAL